MKKLGLPCPGVAADGFALIAETVQNRLQRLRPAYGLRWVADRGSADPVDDEDQQQQHHEEAEKELVQESEQHDPRSLLKCLTPAAMTTTTAKAAVFPKDRIATAATNRTHSKMRSA